MRKTRDYCFTCLRTPENCYCEHVRRFDPKIRFVILLHSRENQKHIATGRLAHLCVERSEVILGYDNSREDRVNELLVEPGTLKAILYPGETSINLSVLTPIARATLFPPEKELVLFVVDGTWTTARKTMSNCENLRALPRLSFDVPAPSRIRLRQQPAPHCITTAEAIHHTIELLGSARGFDTGSRVHDALLASQEAMVSKQAALAKLHYPAFWG